MPQTATPKPVKNADLTYLDKRVLCQLRSNLVLHLGLMQAALPVTRKPPEFLRIQHPATGDYVIQMSLIRVTPKLIYYREVMSDGKANFNGDDRVNDQQR